MMNSDQYQTVGVIVGVIVFICIWIYALAAWGFLIGLAIGWLPAIIGGSVAGFLWPLIVAVLAIVIGFIMLSA